MDLFRLHSMVFHVEAICEEDGQAALLRDRARDKSPTASARAYVPLRLEATRTSLQGGHVVPAHQDDASRKLPGDGKRLLIPVGYCTA